MTLADEEIPRPAVVRLVRFGFEDGARAARLLSDPALGLWDLERNEPADPEAGPVVAALARAGDPDLAAPLAAPAGRGPRRARTTPGRPPRRCWPACAARGCCAAGCSRCSARAPGWPTTSPAHPADWTVLDDDGDGVARGSDRPAAEELQRDMLAAVGADPDDPPWGVQAGQGRPRRLAEADRRAPRWPTGGRSSPSPAATWATGCPPRRPPPSWPTSPPPSSPPGWPSPSPSSRPPPRPAGWRSSRLGKTGGRELNYVSDVDVVFVAEPVDPTDSESAALTSATRVAAALMRICHEAAWEVDAALRPEGKAGALVRTVAGHAGLLPSSGPAPGSSRRC